MRFKRFLWQLLIWLDQGVNVMTGGYADETLSARTWRNRMKSKGWARLHKIIDGIFFWEYEHCYESYVNEVDRIHMHPEYRMVDA